MPLSNYALDNFVSKNLSQLNECNCKHLKQDFQKCEEWLSGFILAPIFHMKLDEPTTKFAFALLRKAEALFDEYDQACELLKSFVSNGSHSPSKYFRCLRHFENTIAMLYQSYELGRGLVGHNLFRNDDGSSLQRLNNVYNDSRHSNLSLVPGGHLHRVWIDNHGIHTAKASLKFQELEAMIREIGSIANTFGTGKLVKKFQEKQHSQESANA